MRQSRKVVILLQYHPFNLVKDICHLLYHLIIFQTI
jgi:hypothetical protein